MKKYAIAALIAIAVFAISAFAASLNVNAGTLQAGTDQIDDCIEDPDGHVVVSYGEPDFVDGEWLVDEITLDHGGDCDELAYRVVITGDNDLEVGPFSGVFDGGAELVEDLGWFNAEDATDVHLVIRNANN
jgi:hypothetical protein